MRTQRKILFLTLCPLFIPCVLCGLVSSDFQRPLKENTYITGTFGEFRRHHIHAGIDISTAGRIGLPVYAGGKGLLYRIKRQVLGFGKAVYIKLEDGKYLVYAHLDRFSPKIENLLVKEENYQVDIYLKEKITINKGELIGYSGNTGGVVPHLHVELRDADERPINPLSVFDIKDTAAPVIAGIAACDPVTTYCISETIPPVIRGRVGLAVSAYDPSHGNKLSVYQINLIVDRKLFFTVKMDTFSYDDFNSNFLLCNKDLYVNHKKIYYHLFRAFGNKLPFNPLDSDGVLDLSPGKHSIVIEVLDYAGNKTSQKFNVVSTAPSASLGAGPSPLPDRQAGMKKTWYSKDKLCKITIDQYYPIEIEMDKVSPNVYNIKPKKAVFKKADISIKGDGHIYISENGKWKYLGKDTVTVTDLGKFAVFKDTTPPLIKIISTFPAFRAKIDDNGSGLDHDKLFLFIDGKRVPAEYSANRKELFYAMPKGKHKIECIAGDKVDNIAKRLL